MKKNDIIFIICAVLFFAPFFFSNTVYGWFISATNTHPYLMSFAKFAILSTAGECIGLRIKTGNYSSKGFVRGEHCRRYDEGLFPDRIS